MPPKAKEPKKGNYKPGTPLKDLIPATVKQPPRDPRPIRLADYVPTNTIVNPYQPQPEFEDWPGDEAALNFDFGLESQTGKQYTDPVQFPVPPSFKTKESDIVFWQRPRELIKSELATPAASFSSLNSKPKVRRQKTGIDGELLQGRLSIDENAGLGPFDQEDVEITLFSYGEREETAEEAEQRVKELMEKQQQQKKKPPPGKKEEPVDTAPQKIKEVKLSNVSMKDEIPAYSKWIASQIQVIKDRNIRDVNTRKPIWTRIYPQKEGVPVLNPSGRYWVKLYHMGKEKKIDIDDRVPVVYGNGLFAKSVNENEIWTFILSKALIKLNASRWNDPKAKDIEVGDGSIIYALTGYVPETISIPQNIQDKWKSISYALSDKKYDCGDKYLTCFSMPGFKPYAPSNKVRNPKDIGLDSKRSAKRDSTKSPAIAPRGLSVPSKQLSDTEPQSTSSIGSPSIKKKEPALTVVKSPRQDSTRREEGGRERPSNVITGFSYSIIDAFENDNFNMAYALKRSENEVKLRTDLANMQKISLNKMSREEKVEHRKLVKELKEKLAVEDAKRRELVKVPAEHYRLLKIKSSIGNVSALSFNTFDQDDVTLARKCILNKLSKPPNYELYDIKPDETKSAVSTAQIETQKILPLDDFSRIENAKEPLKRPPGGTWVTDLDLEGCFQFLQVFHDPTRFKYRETHTLAARQDEELISYEDKEVIVIEAQTEEEEKEKDKDREHNTFVYSFSSTRPANMAVDPKPSLVLQKYDFLHFEVAQSYKPLNQVHDSNCLTLENKNQVFRVQLTSPLSCFLWISSDMHYKLMSMADFLCTYEGYHVKNQPIEYPVIEKNRYHLFYKGIINSPNQKEHIICRIKNAADAVMLRSVRIKLIELTNKDYVSEEDFATGVVTFPLEKAYYTAKSVPITLEPGKKYMIVVEGRMSETVNEGTLDFDILYSDTEFNIETVEQVEPVEYMDKYVPTKYGVLFSERLFVNNDVQTSFFARISDVLGNSGQQQNAQKGKKGEVVQVEEKDISEQRTIKLELFRDDELVAFAFGQNKAVISNVALYPTNNKDEPRSYLLQARFDLREWPECKEENEFTSNLHWTLKVCGNDTVGVVRDTIKEDNVKAIKKAWEDKEPGRAGNAKTARKKYLILAKIRRGEQVTQDELNLVNEPRQKKNKEEDLKKDAKGKAPPPKGKPAPPVKGGKKDEAPVEEKKEDKPLPKSEDHVMSEICSFLTHMEQPRLLEEGDEGKGPMVRTEEEQSELREKILLGREEIYGMTERNKLSKQKIKDILSGNKDKVLKDSQAKRQDNKEKISAIMKDREEFRKKDKEIKDRYRTVTALCRQEKPTLEEVVKALNDHAGYVDADLLKVLEKVRKNAYIGEKVDRMNAALVAYDIPTITAVLDEFRTEEIEIDEELYMKAEELIDMAEKNPTFIADKQKEAQKAQKGKKK